IDFFYIFFFFQAEDGIRDGHVTGVQTCALPILMHTNKTDILSNLNLNRIDYIIFTDKDIYLAHQLEALGIRLFNSALSTDISDDKIKTYQKLMKSNLPIPETLIARSEERRVGKECRSRWAADS